MKAINPYTRGGYTTGIKVAGYQESELIQER